MSTALKIAPDAAADTVPGGLDVNALPTAIAQVVSAIRASGGVVADVYSELGAPIYHCFTSVDTDELRLVLRLLAGARGPVADLAAGSGRFSLPLAARGHEVVAVDLSPHMLALLRAQLAKAGAALQARVTVCEADLSQFAFPTSLSAVVMGAGSISLFDRDQRISLLERTAHSLAPQGRALISIYSMAGLPDAGVDSCQVFAIPEQGFAITLMDHVDRASHRRTVALIPVSPASPHAPLVLLSQVDVVDKAELLSDARAAGLRLLAEHVFVPENDGRAASVLELAHA